MKKDKIKKSIKMIKKYLLSLIDKLSENEFRSNKERKIDNAFFLIVFLTTNLKNSFKELEFFKSFEKDVVHDLIEINYSQKTNTIEIDYSKILYSIDSLYSISEVKYTTPDSVLIHNLTQKYIEDIKKAAITSETSFEKTGQKIIIF